MAWSDVILHAKLILFFTDHAATEPLADARGTLGFRGTLVENHCPMPLWLYGAAQWIRWFRHYIHPYLLITNST